MFVKAHVGLANRRLSIISPGAASNQPMTDASGRYTIVYNGEIFNYEALRKTLQGAGFQFRTDSDTEVVLQLYRKEGSECLKKLKGFFAFAIYDAAEDTLFLARDRHGEKPLLYYKSADYFLFGSELAALFELGVPRELDYTALYQYLQLTYVPAPATMLQGVKKLLPGHSLLIKGSRMQEAVWYRLPFDADKAAANPLSAKQQQAKLLRLLEQAVEDRLTADVPVGAFLSGGIDSSVVVALAAKNRPNFKTFSLGYKKNPFFDETKYARLVAAKYKTDHTELLLTPQDLHGHLLGMLDALSEPFADSSALAVYLLSKSAGASVKAVLSGDGADELFAGYNKHRAEYRLLHGGMAVEAVTKLKNIWNILPQSRNSAVANKVRQLHRFAAGAQLAPRERYWFWATWQNEQEALALLRPEYRFKAVNRLYHARKSRLLDHINSAHYDLNSVLCADWHLVLANDMLPKIDLMGMANGLEIRSPFLDHRVVKFAFSLPVAAKIDGHLQKKLVQDTFRSLLPQELYNRPKKGFEVPLLSLLQTDAQEYVKKYLADDFIEAQGIFDVAEIRKLQKVLFSGGGGGAPTIAWVLLVFQYWWQKYLNN